MLLDKIFNATAAAASTDLESLTAAVEVEEAKSDQKFAVSGL